MEENQRKKKEEKESEMCEIKEEKEEDPKRFQQQQQQQKWMMVANKLEESFIRRRKRRRYCTECARVCEQGKYLQILLLTRKSRAVLLVRAKMCLMYNGENRDFLMYSLIPFIMYKRWIQKIQSQIVMIEKDE